MPCWPPLPAPKKATLVPLMAGTIGFGGMNEVKLSLPVGTAVLRSSTFSGGPVSPVRQTHDWLPVLVSRLATLKKATLLPSIDGMIGGPGMKNAVKLPVPLGIAVFKSATLTGSGGMVGLPEIAR